MLKFKYFSTFLLATILLSGGCSIKKLSVDKSNVQICGTISSSIPADRKSILALTDNLALEGDKFFFDFNYENAHDCYQTALDAQINSLETDNSSILKNLYNIATIHEVKEQYSQAESLYIKALNLLKLRKQSNPTKLKEFLGYLAAIRYQKSYNWSEQKLKGYLIAFKQLKDSRNIRVGVVEHRLAQIHLKSKHYNQSEKAFNKALSIIGQQIGNLHPYYAKTLQDYARLLLLTNRKKQAILLQKQVNLIFDNYPKKLHTKLYKNSSVIN